MNNESFAIICLRLLGLLILALGTVWLVANVLESAWDFNPNYLIYFFAMQVLRPLLMIVTGILFMLFSRKLGGLIAKC